jgi:hypothetical protein
VKPPRPIPIGVSRRRPRVGFALVLVALALLAGCNRQDRRGRPTLDEAPNLGGRYLDAEGVARTRVDVRAVLQMDVAAEDEVPARGVLAGYEFEAFRGGLITAVLDVPAPAGTLGLAFYGPRSLMGLWESPLVETAGATPGRLTLSTDALPQAGQYLVLVWSGSHASKAQFTLTLTCAGNCGAPTCPELAPCDLVCDHGFVLDATGCRTCACQAAPQCGADVGECPPGQYCADDGRCQVRPPPPPECTEERPVCDTQGETWPNACSAERAGREVAYDGRCNEAPAAECDAERPCAAPQVCVESLCRAPVCDCPDEHAPVCSVTRQTYRNLCELTCREGAAALAYHGECLDLRPCREAADCPEGRICEAVRDRENLARCAADPDALDCQRVCVMAAPQTLCGGDRPACPAASACYGDEDGGVCLTRCAFDGAGTCGAGMRCAAVDAIGLSEGEGVCLPGCRPGGRGGCPQGLLCLPDERSQPVCQSCDCPWPEPGEEVCTDQQQQYPSACHAQCAGAVNWRSGRCDGQAACECEFGYAPVCGADGVLHNRCEARCAEPPIPVLGDVSACLPRGAGVTFACERDEDCMVGACEGRLCAAGPVAAAVCPAVSPELACYARFGECGCVANRCTFGATRDVVRCLEADVDAAEPSSPAFPRR